MLQSVFLFQVKMFILQSELCAKHVVKLCFFGVSLTYFLGYFVGLQKCQCLLCKIVYVKCEIDLKICHIYYIYFFTLYQLLNKDL